MWNHRYLTRIDMRMLPVMLALMGVSFLILSAYPLGGAADAPDTLWNPLVKNQMRRFALGWCVYFFCAGLDYQKLREWTWVLYVFMIVALVGVFFTSSIAQVHRWYRVPIIGVGFQPSEYTKVAVVLALAWFLERNQSTRRTVGTALHAGIIVAIPFILILKQPDLGTAMVLFPVTVVMFYLGGLHPLLIKGLVFIGVVLLSIVLLIFLGVISHESARPYVTKVMHEYQFNRLDPNQHHQQAAISAIAIGGILGKGWRQGDFTNGGWLPMPVTDSVFPAFGEEFGLLGLGAVMALFYLLIYFGFQVTAVAKDEFGRLLSAGISVYLAVHIIVNIGMMSGLLPITGVPLVLVTYGGSSIFTAMAALGLQQSVYSRRFMF